MKQTGVMQTKAPSDSRLAPAFRARLSSLGWMSSTLAIALWSGPALAQTQTEITIPDSAPTAPQSSVPPAPAAAPAVVPAAPAPPQRVTIPEIEIPSPQAVPPRAVPRPTAAPPETGPTKLIFSERSKGCQTVIRTNQAVTGLCGDQPPAPTATPPGGRRTPALAGNPGMSGPTVAPGPGGRLSYVPRRDMRAYYRRSLRPPGRLGNGNVRLLFPLSIPAAISSAFGWRIHPVTGEHRFHTGTDIAAPLGTPVLAAYAGQVAIADWLGGYGLTVTIQHENGTQETLYAHLSEIFVKPGETVEQGAVIGRVGSTGLSTGPHLHFEFRQLTPDGWVTLDAGAQLEFALGELVRAMNGEAPVRDTTVGIGREAVPTPPPLTARGSGYAQPIVNQGWIVL